MCVVLRFFLGTLEEGETEIVIGRYRNVIIVINNEREIRILCGQGGEDGSF